ncbi:MAG: VTT domain-containing protein [Actinomycetota bacterium]|nr:VTT domain-containing protein [Actinomycetota bacterium]
MSAALAAIATSAVAGNALAPTLVVNHPLLLLALNTTTRHLVLTSTSVDFVPYLVVGLVRRLLEDPLLFLLGRWYGDDAIGWVDDKVGGGRFLRAVQRNFHWIGWLLVAVAPGGVVCVLAGASRMPTAVFLVLNIAGTIATIVALRRFGDSFAGPIDAAVAFIAENVVVLTAASVGLTVAYVLRRRRVRAGASAATLAEGDDES